MISPPLQFFSNIATSTLLCLPGMSRFVFRVQHLFTFCVAAIKQNGRSHRTSAGKRRRCGTQMARETKHHNICGIWMAQKENASEIMAISEALVESGGLARFRAGRVAALTCHRQVIHYRSHRVRARAGQKKSHPDGWLFFWWRVADSNRRPSACEADAITS